MGENIRFTVLTLFPEMFDAFASTSIIGRSVKSGTVKVDTVNFRDFSQDKHKKVDDYPYGGGSGMVIGAEPLMRCMESLGISHRGEGRSPGSKVIYMSPRGRVLSHRMAEELALGCEEIVIVCGHYEGVDQRFIDEYVDMEASIGDYVLTGGELPAMVLMDAVARLRGDVLGSDDSHLDESHARGLLEYPQYTRPRTCLGVDVPEELLSGDHKRISKWRYYRSLDATAANRPDMLVEYAGNGMDDDECFKSFTKREKQEAKLYVSALLESIRR
jgi:tRNA (guanine37-N1)-methyltransferase